MQANIVYYALMVEQTTNIEALFYIPNCDFNKVYLADYDKVCYNTWIYLNVLWNMRLKLKNNVIAANRLEAPCRVGLVVSVCASHTVCRGFASRPGLTKDHHKNGTNCLPA